MKILLQNKLRIIINGFRFDSSSAIRKLLRIAILLILPIWIYRSTFFMLSGWSRMADIPASLYFDYVALLLKGLVIFLMLSGVPVALHYFFQSKDLPLLLSLPIPFNKVVLFKFVETAIANSSIFAIFALPAILALCLALKLPLVIFCIALLGSFLLLFIPTGIATVIGLGTVKLFALKRAKNITTVLIGLLFAVTWAALQFLRFSRLDPNTQEFDFRALDRIPRVVSNDYLAWFPSDQLCNALYNLNSGAVIDAVIHLVFLALSALFFLFLSVLLIGYVYRRDLFFSAQIVTFNAAKQKSISSPSTRTTEPYAWSLFRQLFSRDFKLLFRDSRHTTQFILFFAMLIVLPLAVHRDFDPMGSDLELFYPYMILFLFASFFATGMSARLFPLEGRSFGINRSVPLSAWIVLGEKITLSAFITSIGVICAISFVALRFRSPLPVYIFLLFASFFLTLGATGIGSFLGSSFAKFDWDHPRQMLKSEGNILLLVFDLLFWLIGVGLVAVGYPSKVRALIFLGCYCSVSCAVGTVLAYRRLNKLEWLL